MNSEVDVEGTEDLFAVTDVLKENSAPHSNLSSDRSYGTEESLINEKEFRRALDRFFTQSQSIATTDFDVGEPLSSLNEFEKLLSETFGVELRIDGEKKISTYIAGRLSHSALVKRFEKIFETKEKIKDEFLHLFANEIDDEEKIRIYLSPTTSERGLLGTFFRATLLVKPIQVDVFEMLMKKAECFAKRKDADNTNNIRLALSCVSQIRYLEVIYDPKALFTSVFSRDIENWSPTVRDSLIQALPEILLNVGVQQDAAEVLSRMFLKGVSECSLAFRDSILRTLMMLRCDFETSLKIRRSFIRNIMKIELGVLPKLVDYCISSVQKDERGGYSDLFFGLRKNLNLEKMSFSRKDESGKDVDAIIAEIFEQISRKARFGNSRFWKEVVYVLQHEGEMGNEDDDYPAELHDEGLGTNFKEFCTFDVMLSLSLMSAESCDRSISSTFRHQISHCRCHLEMLKEEIRHSLDFKRFSSHFLHSISMFCEQLMWSFLPNFAHIGSFMLGHLFTVVFEKRKEVLNVMITHLNDVDCEASAVLDVLEFLTEKYITDLVPFTTFLQGALNSLPFLSVENSRRLFYVLVTVHAANHKNVEATVELKLRIERFLSSSSRRERIWGVMGMLMELQQQLRTVPSGEENRENVVEKILNILDDRTKSDSHVRAVFYTHLTHVIKENPKVPASDAILEWSGRLQLEFREVFFQNRTLVPGKNYYEDVRYIQPQHNEWLRLSELVSQLTNDKAGGNRERIFELIPLFELLRAFARQRQRWDGDDTQKAHEHHWKQFLFAFEANISMTGVDAETSESSKRRFNNDVFCFAIQWIRLMLNTFAECELAEPELDVLVKELMKKKFLLMVECQKSLVFTAEKLGEYILPHLYGYQKEIVVQKRSNSEEKKCGQRNSRKTQNGDCLVEENHGEIGGDEVLEGNSFDDEHSRDRNRCSQDGDGAESVAIAKGKFERKRKSDHFRKHIETGKILSYFSPFQLLTIAKLLKLLPNKRKQTRFLLECLQKILKTVFPKKEKRVAPWMLTSDTPLFDMPVNHGDHRVVWRTIHALIPLVFQILNNAVEYFKSLHDTTELLDNKQRDCFNDMVQLLNACLFVFKDIFSCRDIAKPETAREEMNESERDRRARFERRKCVMEKLEHVMIDTDLVNDTHGEEDAEVSVLRYFLSIGEIIPALDSAVALLGVLFSIEILPEEERFKTARIALLFLRREWIDGDGNPLKGTFLNRAVGEILHYYVRLRKDSKRLLAIQWLLAAEVSSLVPEEERRRSKISSLEECDDDELLDEDKHGHFCCFTKGTFSTVYKVLFRSLNDTVKNYLTLQGVVNGDMSLDECFLQWKRAASCFCLLTLMIRVKDLRNLPVLMCAAREGRLFLYNFASKSSFMHLLQGEKRFAKYAAGANAVFKTVQIGNRSLQNMSVYAKTKKCAVLLRMLPELRALSELFIRTVHSVMVGVDCDEAFQIGLLKSRDLDGEEVKCTDETVDDMEAGGDNEEVTGNEEPSDEMQEDEEEANNQTLPMSPQSADSEVF